MTDADKLCIPLDKKFCELNVFKTVPFNFGKKVILSTILNNDSTVW